MQGTEGMHRAVWLAQLRTSASQSTPSSLAHGVAEHAQLAVNVGTQGLDAPVHLLDEPLHQLRVAHRHDREAPGGNIRLRAPQGQRAAVLGSQKGHGKTRVLTSRPSSAVEASATEAQARSGSFLIMDALRPLRLMVLAARDRPCGSRIKRITVSSGTARWVLWWPAWCLLHHLPGRPRFRRRRRQTRRCCPGRWNRHDASCKSNQGGFTTRVLWLATLRRGRDARRVSGSTHRSQIQRRMLQTMPRPVAAPRKTNRPAGSAAGRQHLSGRHAVLWAPGPRALLMHDHRTGNLLQVNLGVGQVAALLARAASRHLDVRVPAASHDSSTRYICTVARVGKRSRDATRKRCRELDCNALTRGRPLLRSPASCRGPG